MKALYRGLSLARGSRARVASLD